MAFENMNIAQMKVTFLQYKRVSSVRSEMDISAKDSIMDGGLNQLFRKKPPSTRLIRAGINRKIVSSLFRPPTTSRPTTHAPGSRNRFRRDGSMYRVL